MIEIFVWTAFALSGIAGISYELIWVRYVGYFMGSSTPAIAITVSIFLAGLATGSALAGRFFDRARTPLVLYALLELSIGAIAVFQPWAFRMIEHQFAEGATGGYLASVGIIAAAIAPFTIVLGATFPAMAAVVKELGKPIKATGMFYGLNTLGSAVGVVIVSFFLIPALGLDATNTLMASINFFIGASVLVLSRSQRGATPFVRRTQPQSALELTPGQRIDPAPSPIPIGTTEAAIIAAASGFFSIGLEVSWTRALALTIPATVYVFALVLTAYLLGIGAGSLAVASLKRSVHSLRLLAFAYLFAGLGAIGTSTLFSSLSSAGLALVDSRVVGSWSGYIVTLGTTTVLAMLPATFFMGASLPVLIGIMLRGKDSAHLAGRLYAANVIGGVCGSLATTFVLMPALGLSRSIFLTSLGYVFLALFLARQLSLDRTVYRLVAAASILILLLGVLGLHPPIVDIADSPQTEVLFHRDSPSATVTVERYADGNRALKVNNSYALNDMSPASTKLHDRLGRYPLRFHRHPKRSLLIGFATGNTLAAMAESDLDQLDCVEIHGLLFKLAPYFQRINRNVNQDPRVRLITADGRQFLSRRGPNYDVIVGDLYLPLSPGVGALYSVQHFSAVRSRLNASGVFVAWLPLWQLGSNELASIAKTFVSVFPNGEAWLMDDIRPVLGLIAINDPGSVSASTPWHGPESPTAFRRKLDNAQLRVLGDGARLNTLRSPVIEFEVPKSYVHELLTKKSYAAANLELLDRIARQGGRRQ